MSLLRETPPTSWQTVFRNVGIASRQRWQERVLKTLREADLFDMANGWPSVLSGGQKQRVSPARDLVSEPDILLLLDEPFGALSVLPRIELHELFTRLWLENRFTTVLTTHDVSKAVALADRVIVLRDGLIALYISINLHRSLRSISNAALSSKRAARQTIE